MVNLLPGSHIKKFYIQTTACPPIPGMSLSGCVHAFYATFDSDSGLPIYCRVAQTVLIPCLIDYCPVH